MAGCILSSARVGERDLKMARLVRHDESGPYELPPQPNSAWLCGCGLSQNRPHCDGSHKLVRSESDGVICVYDSERRAIIARLSEDAILQRLREHSKLDPDNA